jgi:hypothetical protein
MLFAPGEMRHAAAVVKKAEAPETTSSQTMPQVFCC